MNIINEYTKRQIMINSGYEIFHYNTKNRVEVELHHHDFYELYYFISGNVTYNINCRSFLLKPGDILLISPSELHKPDFLNDTDKYERIVLWISKKHLEKLSTEQTNVAKCFEIATQREEYWIPYNHNLSPSVKYNLEKLIKATGSDAYGSDIMRNIYIQNILIKITEYLTSNEREINRDLTRSTLIENALQYINNNLSEDLRLDIISKNLFSNKYYLAHEFKRHLGINIGRYITLKRLAFSKELLIKGETVQKISVVCGYKNISNFFRVFKNEYGITPKEYYKLMN